MNEEDAAFNEEGNTTKTQYEASIMWLLQEFALSQGWRWSPGLCADQQNVPPLSSSFSQASLDLQESPKGNGLQWP